MQFVLLGNLIQIQVVFVSFSMGGNIYECKFIKLFGISANLMSIMKIKPLENHRLYSSTTGVELKCNILNWYPTFAVSLNPVLSSS